MKTLLRRLRGQHQIVSATNRIERKTANHANRIRVIRAIRSFYLFWASVALAVQENAWENTENMHQGPGTPQL